MVTYFHWYTVADGGVLYDVWGTVAAADCNTSGGVAALDYYTVPSLVLVYGAADTGNMATE